MLLQLVCLKIGSNDVTFQHITWHVLTLNLNIFKAQMKFLTC